MVVASLLLVREFIPFRVTQGFTLPISLSQSRIPCAGNLHSCDQRPAERLRRGIGIESRSSSSVVATGASVASATSTRAPQQSGKPPFDREPYQTVVPNADCDLLISIDLGFWLVSAYTMILGLLMSYVLGYCQLLTRNDELIGWVREHYKFFALPMTCMSLGILCISIACALRLPSQRARPAARCMLRSGCTGKRIGRSLAAPACI